MMKLEIKMISCANNTRCGNQHITSSIAFSISIQYVVSLLVSLYINVCKVQTERTPDKIEKQAWVLIGTHSSMALLVLPMLLGAVDGTTAAAAAVATATTVACRLHSSSASEIPFAVAGTLTLNSTV